MIICRTDSEVSNDDAVVVVVVVKTHFLYVQREAWIWEIDGRGIDKVKRHVRRGPWRYLKGS